MVIIFSQTAFADFGEIDLIVQESVSDEFRDNGFSVDTSKIEYRGQPQIQDGIMIVRSTVWGESGQLRNKWAWHSCETKIAIAGSRNSYKDLGSRCWLDFD